MPDIDFDAAVGETLSLPMTLTGADRRVQDLTQATAVKVTIKHRDTGAIVVNDRDCTFLADARGLASYTEAPSVITWPAGWYQVRVAALFPGSIKHSFPNRGWATLLVSP